MVDLLLPSNRPWGWRLRPRTPSRNQKRLPTRAGSAAQFPATPDKPCFSTAPCVTLL